MKDPVVLQRTEEGFSVGCPALRGCWSQGTIEQEALENIQNAIQESLAAVRDSMRAANCVKLRWQFEVPRIPGIAHLRAVRALEKADAVTMGGIARDAGLSVDQFRALL